MSVTYCKLPNCTEIGWLSEPAIPALSQEVNACRHCNENTTGTPNINAKYKFYKKCHKFIKRNPTRCNNVSKFYYSIFIWSSTCFGRHTAHHQEPKTALAASGFSCVEGCFGRMVGGRCQAHCAWQRPPTTRPTAFHVWKTRGCQCSFRLLMMDCVSPETYWTSYKYGIIKFWYIVATCWIFLYEL